MECGLALVLTRVSVELASLAEVAMGLQTHIGAPGPGEESIEALQALDVVTQSLACLAGFVAAVGTAAPDAEPVEIGPALDRVWLSALARRLAGGSAAGADPDAPFGAGDVELFDEGGPSEAIGAPER